VILPVHCLHDNRIPSTRRSREPGAFGL
jgi:hypothetical protein